MKHVAIRLLATALAGGWHRLPGAFVAPTVALHGLCLCLAANGTLDGQSRVTGAIESDGVSATRDENWTLSQTGNWVEHRLDLDGDLNYNESGGGEMIDAGTFNKANLKAFAERFARSIREECLARIIPLGERHVRLTIEEYASTITSNGTTKSSATGSSRAIFPGAKGVFDVASELEEYCVSTAVRPHDRDLEHYEEECCDITTGKPHDRDLEHYAIGRLRFCTLRFPLIAALGTYIEISPGVAALVAQAAFPARSADNAKYCSPRCCPNCENQRGMDH